MKMKSAFKPFFYLTHAVGLILIGKKYLPVKTDLNVDLFYTFAKHFINFLSF